MTFMQVRTAIIEYKRKIKSYQAQTDEFSYILIYLPNRVPNISLGKRKQHYAYH